MISSIDERVKILNQFLNTHHLKSLQLNFWMVGRRKGKNINPIIQITRDTQTLQSLKPKIRDSFALLDLVREGQNGLSFRPFEAMALEKKLITNNPIIKEYAFYNPNNIWWLESMDEPIPDHFFESPYEPLSKEIYNQFTVETWVQKIFKLS